MKVLVRIMWRFAQRVRLEDLVAFLLQNTQLQAVRLKSEILNFEFRSPQRRGPPGLATCHMPLATLSIGQLQFITTSAYRRAPDSRDDDFRISIFEFRFLADRFRRCSVPTLS